jgi:hypothetical protein
MKPGLRDQFVIWWMSKILVLASERYRRALMIAINRGLMTARYPAAEEDADR